METKAPAFVSDKALTPSDPVAATLVDARGVGKVYRRYPSSASRLVELLTGRRQGTEFVALSDVSFRIAAGAGFGIVGENGAGKSTLLKILAGVTAPTTGAIAVSGTVASILELGAGFHPDFTGRQNVRLNAALFGLSERELERRLPSILEFSELGEFLDQPVKTYSSGMAMRLAFSIATQLEPAILIIDEALSVGDGYFQKKCMDRLQRYREAGGTLLLCSHAMYYVSAFCETTLWLRNGQVAGLGPSGEVVRAYESFLEARSKARSDGELAVATETSGPGRLRRVYVAGSQERPPLEPLEVEIEWDSESPDWSFHLAVGINRSDEIEILSFSSARDGRPPFLGAREYRTVLRIPELPMVKGDYTLYVFLLDDSALHIHDRRILPSFLSIRAEGYRFGLIDAPHEWLTEPAQRSA